MVFKLAKSDVCQGKSDFQPSYVFKNLVYTHILWDFALHKCEIVAFFFILRISIWPRGVHGHFALPKKFTRFFQSYQEIFLLNSRLTLLPNQNKVLF